MTYSSPEYLRIFQLSRSGKRMHTDQYRFEARRCLSCSRCDYQELKQYLKYGLHYHFEYVPPCVQAVDDTSCGIRAVIKKYTQACS